MLPREPRNIRAGDANIGKFAVVEIGKLPHRRAVSLPSVKIVDEGYKHFWFLPRRRRNVGTDIVADIALQNWICCSAAKTGLHV